MHRPKILVVEDECILACDLCQTVEEAGYCVEGPHRDVATAMEALERSTPDLAILDIYLGNQVVYPLAELLMKDDIPVIFHSGRRTPSEMSERFRKPER